MYLRVCICVSIIRRVSFKIKGLFDDSIYNNYVRSRTEIGSCLMLVHTSRAVSSSAPKIEGIYATGRIFVVVVVLFLVFVEDVAL